MPTAPAPKTYRSPVIGIGVELPTGGCVPFLFRLLPALPAGPLTDAYLIQRACRDAGLYDRRVDWPSRFDLPWLLRGAHAYRALLNGDHNLDRWLHTGGDEGQVFVLLAPGKALAELASRRRA